MKKTEMENPSELTGTGLSFCNEIEGIFLCSKSRAISSPQGEEKDWTPQAGHAKRRTPFGRISYDTDVGEDQRTKNVGGEEDPTRGRRSTEKGGDTGSPEKKPSELPGGTPVELG